MSEEQKTKRRTPLVEWMEGLSEEERKAHVAKAHEGRRRQAEERRQRLAEAKKEADRLLPRILAEEIKSDIQGKDWKPSQETRDKLALLVDKGLTLKEIRLKYCSGVEQVVWDKIVRDMLKNQVANEEDLGIQLLQSQQTHLKNLQKQLKAIRKDIRTYKKQKKDVPFSLRKMELEITDRIFRLSVDNAEAMLKLGVVGEKQKAANINIHMSLPRPEKKVEQVIEVK